MNARDLVGWTPIRLFWPGAEPLVDWALLDQERLTAPFFEQTVGRVMTRPFNLLFRHQTPVEALAELREINPGLPPNGFIFHMSRCGSTLVSQMLASVERTIVLSEAPPIDSVLRANIRLPHLTDEQRIDWLRGMISALGQRRHETESQLFIKFDSWHILDLPLIEKAFPGVPWIFLYRDPVEVMASHLRSRGGQMIPGHLKPELAGLNMEQVARMSLDEYGVRLLAKFCEAALEHMRGGRGRLVNYNQLPDIFFSELLDHFGVAYTAEELERMRATMQFDAKRPGIAFKSDAAEKQLEVPDEARALVTQWIGPIYERLEKSRLS